jgi:hypothetical protein
MFAVRSRLVRLELDGPTIRGDKSSSARKRLNIVSPAYILAGLLVVLAVAIMF